MASKVQINEAKRLCQYAAICWDDLSEGRRRGIISALDEARNEGLDEALVVVDKMNMESKGTSSAAVNIVCDHIAAAIRKLKGNK